MFKLNMTLLRTNIIFAAKTKSFVQQKTLQMVMRIMDTDNSLNAFSVVVKKFSFQHWVKLVV